MGLEKRGGVGTVFSFQGPLYYLIFYLVHVLLGKV